jgi:PadR family transcriptional regulator PadR
MVDTRTALLQALFKGESYGLELIQRVTDLTDGRIVLMQGRVYPVLREMEDEGLLRSFDGPAVQSRGGRPRRYYELTAQGRRAANADARAITRLFEARAI